MGIRRHLLLRDAHKILQHFLHQLVLTEAVNKINTSLSFSYPDYPVYQIKACVHRQPSVHISHIFLQGSRHLPLSFLYIHKKTPSSEFTKN